MSIDLFFQILVNGLMSGGIYALIASGFTLILGVIKIFNFAQGQFYMLGAFITFGIVTSLGLPYPVGILAALILMFILGVIFHLTTIQWTIPFGFFHTMLVTIAFSTLIGQVSLLTFGRDQGMVSEVLPGTLNIHGITLNNSKLLVIAGAIIVMVGLYYFIKTKIGTAMLAAAENKEVAQLQGINTSRIFWITMGIGCGLCGIAGALIVPILSATSAMGINAFTRSMLVVLVGGTGSMSGALLAAFIVGIIESFAFQYVGQLSVVAIFVFAGILLFFRPGGLLGKPLPIPGQ